MYFFTLGVGSSVVVLLSFSQHHYQTFWKNCCCHLKEFLGVLDWVEICVYLIACILLAGYVYTVRWFNNQKRCAKKKRETLNWNNKIVLCWACAEIGDAEEVPINEIPPPPELLPEPLCPPMTSFVSILDAKPFRFSKPLLSHDMR